MDLTDASAINNCFYAASDVESITFTGLLKINGLSLNYCTNISKESLLSLIEVLEDKTGDTSGTEWVVTIGSTNKAKLTDDELLVARNKGWTVN